MLKILYFRSITNTAVKIYNFHSNVTNGDNRVHTWFNSPIFTCRNKNKHLSIKLM